MKNEVAALITDRFADLSDCAASPRFLDCACAPLEMTIFFACHFDQSEPKGERRGEIFNAYLI